MSSDADRFDGIAIIGMAGRFPGAKDINEYWENLRAGKESITFFTDDELTAAGIPLELLNHPNYVKAKGMMEGTDLFDASYFSVNPREAELMDPQHRLFLECAVEALENAGYDPDRYGERIGVFAGAGMNTYILNLLSNRDLVDMVGGFQVMITNDKDYVPTLVSYKLNLRGPSVNVQTACSTGLVAVHLGCQSVLSGECEVALAGAVSVASPQKGGYMYTEGGIHSPDGHCRAFDAEAKGTLDGEGVGIVVLKHLDRALADGDQIRAVIRGSSINNDGSAKVGYTAPSETGQAQVIAESLALAGVEPDAISYIETHGTGTALGDPIEFAALNQVFRARTNKKNFCAIGSVKTNIGHLGAAAGIAGLIKTVLAFEKQLIPPSLHYRSPNPAINFADSAFYVSRELTAWKANGAPRNAAVSSFGIGGTNAHVVLEEAPSPSSANASLRPQLLTLSARTEGALTRMSDNLSAHVQTHPETNLADLCYTLQTGRRQFNYRRILVSRNTTEAATALAANDPSLVLTGYCETRKQPVFIFPGGGAQYVNMGAELYRDLPLYREEIDRCAEILEPLLSYDPRQLMYPPEGQEEEAARKMEQVAHALPVLFMTEYANARLWMSWGVRPAAMVGHSLGEYAAACIAGVFSLPEALELVVIRGKLFAQLPEGEMLSVALPENALRPLLDSDLSIAAVNGPAQCVVSGALAAVNEFARTLDAKGVENRVLKIRVAAHSKLVEPILQSFRQAVEHFHLAAPSIPFISNVTGTWIKKEEATSPDYWVRHLRQTVRFSAGVQELLKEPERVLLEVGPGRTLSTLAKPQRQYPDTQLVLASTRHPLDSTSDHLFLLTTLGELWLSGVEIEWSRLHRGERRNRVALPSYPFERKRYWVEADGRAAPVASWRKSAALAKKPDIKDWFYLPTWTETAPLAVNESQRLSETYPRILLFVREDGLSARLREFLAQSGCEVVMVQIGDSFSKTHDSAYTLNPARPDDYNELVAQLLVSGQAPAACVHVWSTSPGDADDVESIRPHFERGFYSLVYLAQALSKNSFFEPLKLLVVSSGLHEVTGVEALCAAKAGLVGPCRTIPQEYPNISCCTIDIEEGKGIAGEKEMAEALAAELSAKVSDHTVAYRGRRRWVLTFSTVTLRTSGEAAPVFRERGIYLITGGLGSVGLTLAEYLARTFHARLVLVGRTGLPPREQWSQLLDTNGEQDERIRRILAMEEAGAEVLTLSADVADVEQTREVVRRCFAGFGSLHGVIHAAGVVGAKAIKTIPELTTDECEKQFRPKVAALYSLAQALEGIELDFCVLISSLAAQLGGLGYAAYSSASAFMDAFARSYSLGRSSPWLSVDSDLWEIGAGNASTQTWSQLPMTSEEGCEAIHRVVSNRSWPQILISTGDLQARMDQWLKLESKEGDAEESARSVATYARPNLRNAYVPPSTDLERIVAGILAGRLGIEQVGLYDNFFDLGGQSLLATQVVSALRDAFSIEISLRSLFETPTVAGMSRTIEAIGEQEGVDLHKAAQLILQLDQLSDDEVKLMLTAKAG
jgi:acyl transferase domain-containing protein/acyl carrier protein